MNKSRGGYWYCVPDEKSLSMLRGLASAVSEPDDMEGLHVTLAYDNRNPLSSVPVNEEGSWDARIVGTAMFGQDKDTLVLLLESDELQAEHKRIHSDGAKFDFTPYAPHITLVTNARELERECIQDILDHPKCPPLIIRLINQCRELID